MGNVRTGIAGRLRVLMQKKKQPLSFIGICVCLVIPPGPEKEKLRCAIYDALDRGELKQTPAGRLRYDHTWKLRMAWGPVKKKTFKAMYISSNFAASDIERLTSANRRYINRVIAGLVKLGHLQRHSSNRRGHGLRAERVFYIPDRKKFRIEVMGGS